MDMMELIRTRKSVRTFDGKAVTETDIKKLKDHKSICHFISAAGGALSVGKPDIAVDKDTEYIATVTL